MLKVNYENWHQTLDDLRDLALNGEHPRTRERFLALYEIANGTNATQISRSTARNHQTVIGWVHRYNTAGSESLTYKKTGGRLPLFVKKSSQTSQLSFTSILMQRPSRLSIKQTRLGSLAGH